MSPCPARLVDALTGGLDELLVAALQATTIGRFECSTRQVDQLTVNLLQAHDEHRAISFRKDRWPDLDPVIRSNGEEEAVERGVMQLAQRDTIAHNRFAFEVAVGRDMGGVEELLMPQAT